MTQHIPRLHKAAIFAASLCLMATGISSALAEDRLNPAGSTFIYPISGTTWAVLFVNQPADKGKLIVDFLRWVTHDGQRYVEALHYVRLPRGLVDRVDKKLDAIKVAP